MSDPNTERWYLDPLKMAGGVLIILILCQLFVFLVKPLVPDLIDERSAWVVTAAMLLFYILFNSISTFAAPSLIRNWSRSIYGMGGLSAIGFLISYLLSGKGISDMPGFNEVLMIVFIGFIVLKSIATSIKGIVLFIKQRDAKETEGYEN